MDFEGALGRFGFVPSGKSRDRGVRTYTARPNRFLTYTLQAYGDGSALFSWEFAIGDYLATKGIQLGSDEALNQFMFPREDDRGAQDAAWLAVAIERAETSLSSLRFGAAGDLDQGR